MEERRTKNLYSVLLGGMVIGYTVLYISLIFNDNIWTDEAFTWQLIHSGGLREIVQGTAEDVHPPLYYFWAKLFITLFGDNLQVLKTASIVPMTALLAYIATTVRRTFGDRVSFLTMLFLANIPCTMEFAVQPRMYSASLLAVTVCGVSAYLAFTRNRRRDWALYTVSAIASAYLHYFAFAAAGFIGLILLVCIVGKRIREGKRKDRDAQSSRSVSPEDIDRAGPDPVRQLRSWCLSLALCIAAYAPWIPVLYAQVTSVEEGYWIPAITFDTVREYFDWAFGLTISSWGGLTTWIVMAILVSAGAILVREKAGWGERERGGIAAMLVPSLVFAFGIIASVLPGRSPIYRDQYILPSLGLLALFAGIALSKWDRSVLAGITVFFLFLGACQYRECYRQEYHDSYVEQTKAFFAENASPEDPILYNWKDYGFIYAYYWEKDRLYYYEDFDWAGDYDTAWLLATYNMPLPDAGFLASYGLGIEDMGPYGIEQDNFEIYKITKQGPQTPAADGEQGEPAPDAKEAPADTAAEGNTES